MSIHLPPPAPVTITTRLSKRKCDMKIEKQKQKKRMFIKNLVIQGFKSYKDQTVTETFSKSHNVVGACVARRNAWTRKGEGG